MEFKVGDMVIYKNQTVRVLKDDGINLTLSGFGKVNTKKEQVKLLESVQQPRMKKGYRVIVRDIPENEKQHYGAIWIDEITIMSANLLKLDKFGIMNHWAH